MAENKIKKTKNLSFFSLLIKPKEETELSFSCFFRHYSKMKTKMPNKFSHTNFLEHPGREQNEKSVPGYVRFQGAGSP